MCQWVKRWAFRHLFTLTENLADVWSGFITWSEIIPPLVSLWWLTLTNMFFTVYKLLVLFSPTYGDKCSLHTSFFLFMGHSQSQATKFWQSTIQCKSLHAVKSTMCFINWGCESNLWRPLDTFSCSSRGKLEFLGKRYYVLEKSMCRSKPTTQFTYDTKTRKTNLGWH